MAGKTDIRYEIQVSDGGRWTILTDAPSKLRAIDEAKSILGGGKYDAVKVTEDRGQKSEIVVFEEEGQPRVTKEFTVTPVEEAEVCERSEDVYTFAARTTLGRVLRKYFDQLAITPTELLHDEVNLKALLRQEELVVQAMQTVAGVQARQDKQKPAKRIDVLEKLTRSAVKRAASLEGIEAYLKLLKTKGLPDLIRQIEVDKGDADQFFYVRAALAQRLRNTADWEDKLGELIDLTDKDPDAQSLVVIDEIIAEIFDSSDAVQEILGFQRNLASAMRTLTQLSAGSYEISEGSNSILERVSALMNRYHMPHSQEMMVDRIARTLRSISPLTKGERGEEQETLKSLISELVGNRMLSGNGVLAESLTLRAKSVFRDEFEDEDAERAISEVIEKLPAKSAKFNYLMELASTPLGQENLNHVIELMAYLVDGMTSATDLVEPGGDRSQIIQAAAGIRDRLLETKLPDQWRLRFARDIYELLISYNEGTTRKKSSAAKSKAPPAAVTTKKKTPAKEDGPLDKTLFSAGEYIFHEGDEGDVAYLILSGRVDILRSAGEHEVVIAHAGKGSIVGEMALIDSEPRMASAKTVEETQVTLIPMGEMQNRLKRLEKFDPVMHRLVVMFVQRMRDYKVIDIES